MTSLSGKFLSRALSATALSLPIITFFNYRFYSFHSIGDDLMKPSGNKQGLRQGDIVLVRLADVFPYYFSQAKEKSNVELPMIEGGEKSDMTEALDEIENRENDRSRILRMDSMVGAYPGTAFTPWRSPPLCLPGDVVIFRHPQKGGVSARRLVGTGGQMVRPKSLVRGKDGFCRDRQMKSISPYSVWVEGDIDYNSNDEVADDSNNYGQVSKKLLVGRVERIIWPPSRWGIVERIRLPAERAWWV